MYKYDCAYVRTDYTSVTCCLFHMGLLPIEHSLQDSCRTLTPQTSPACPEPRRVAGQWLTAAPPMALNEWVPTSVAQEGTIDRTI